MLLTIFLKKNLNQPGSKLVSKSEAALYGGRLVSADSAVIAQYDATLHLRGGHKIG